MTSMTGGEAVVRTLQAAGVDTLFGIISVHNIPIYDAIARQGGITPIRVRHEQAATLMADGYARAGGRPGVALSSTGPGAANATAGQFEAYTASSPVLHLTGQIPTQHLDRGKGFLHEAKDQPATLGAVSDFVARVTTTAQIPETIHAALEHMATHRPRPASIEIPIDLQYAESDIEVPEFSVPPRRRPAPEEVRRAAELLRAARRPLLWTGGGVISAGAAPQVRALAEGLGAGVVTSTNGRGSLPESHPLCLGALTMDPAVGDLIAGADLVLAAGTRFQAMDTNEWGIRVPHRLIHIDIDPAEIGRNYPAELGVVADAQAALADLLAAGGFPAPDPTWTSAVTRVRDEARRRATDRLGVHAQVMNDLRAVLPPEAIIVRDATIAAYTWGDRLIPIEEPRTSLRPASAAIGPGLPLALGARVARPDRPVVAICGDGGFMLNLAELATAVEHDLAVVVLLFNDGGYGVLRWIQDLQFGGRNIAVDLHTPDFLTLARGFGCAATAVGATNEFRSAVERALASGRPTLIEVDVAALGGVEMPWGGRSRAVPRRDAAQSR